LEKIKQLKLALHGECDKNIYLYGAGKIGKEIYNEIKKYNKCCIVKAFIDRDAMRKDIIVENIPVISKLELKKRYNKLTDIILITSSSFLDISKELDELEITDYLIANSRFIEYSYNYESIQATLPPFEKAIKWLLNNITSEGGITATSEVVHPYPEVTGYFIPTMIRYGYYDEAKTAVNWLLSIQKEDGGFSGIPSTDSEKIEYVFDTAQILRGLLAFKEDKVLKDDIIRAIDKTCEYLVNQMIDGGKGGYITQYEKDSFAVEPILVYTLYPLQVAAEYRGRNDWLEKARACLEFYIGHEDFLKEETLTHFLAYQVEALIELKRYELIEKIMNYFEEAFNEYGYIPAIKGAKWSCTTGNAQIAICAYLTGKNNLANKLMLQLEENQLSNGGFWGSYNKEGVYFPQIEISWAVKYFLDAYVLKIQEWFNDNFKKFPDDIVDENAEFELVRNAVNSKNNNNIKIADIGCGKGRFLKKLHYLYPEAKLVGVDISQNMIKELPNYVDGIVGTLEHIPLENEAYDIVLCIEALEHSINFETSIKELTRVCKKDGIILIIDKNIKSWGRMECPIWERWCDKENIKDQLDKYCKTVTVENVNLFGQKNDDMFLLWKAVK